MWKPVKGFEGFYEVSDKGEVRNAKTGKLRKLYVKKNGYIDIDLYKNEGKPFYKRVHVLVAEAFIPNPNNYPIVMHKDNNKSNNCVDNLKWGTLSENTKDAYRDKLFIHNKLLKYLVYNKQTGFEKEYIGAQSIKEDLGMGIDTISYYANHPDKVMLRKPFRNFQIKIIGRVADLERSTTIL